MKLKLERVVVLKLIAVRKLIGLIEHLAEHSAVVLVAHVVLLPFLFLLDGAFELLENAHDLVGR